MAYDVNKTDGSLLVSIPDGDLDVTTSLRLLGKNYAGYGEVMAENLVQMLEHFASGTAPANPLPGQLWFSTTTNRLAVFDTGNNWKEIAQLVSNNVEPAGSTRRVGDFWWQPSTGQLYLWNGVKHVPIGFPTGSTTIKFRQITDTLSVVHEAMVFIVDNEILAIMSDDGPYIPAASEKLENGVTALTVEFPTIGKGINMTNRTDFKFRGVALEAEFADIGELYIGDQTYAPGTTVKIGGDREITQTVEANDNNVFGVVSSKPAFLLNSQARVEPTAVPVALNGRVPVRVVGQVRKGDRLVSSSIPGVAQTAGPDVNVFAVIGRSLEDKYTDEEGQVEATVGAK